MTTRTNRATSRRGALLFIVLALLALFAVTAMAYVMITAHYRRAADADHVRGLQTYSAAKDCDAAAMQLLVGSENRNSSIWPHGLLEDVYGSNWQRWRIAYNINPLMLNPGDPTQSQVIEIPIDQTPFGGSAAAIKEALQRCPGSVLTMLDGPAKGKSTRIVGTRQQSGAPANPSAPWPSPLNWPTSGADTYVIQVLAFDGVSSLDFALDVRAAIAAGAARSFLVNGAPFTGTGMGYAGGSPALTATDAAGNELALLPNAAFPSSVDATLATHMNNGALLNEDYDAPDFQNMFLAMQTWNSTGSGYWETPIPSFHRPSLINYWINRAGETTWSGFEANNPELSRRVCLRPSTLDHPNFDGGNPSFDPTGASGSWDVDCDGDGIPDAVWVDIGESVRSTADGRKYKPLYAFLVLDQDGKLNLNTAGSLSQLYSQFESNTYADDDPSVAPSAVLASSLYMRQLFPSPSATVATNANLPRGQGYGPAEVSPKKFLESTGVSSANALGVTRNLLQGGNGLDGRYGDLSQKASAPLTPGPGLSDPAAPVTGATEDRFFNRHRYAWDFANGRPYSYGSGSASLPRPFGSPVDFSGSLSVGTDLVGNPVFRALDRDNDDTNAYNAWTYAFYDNPYEQDLSSSKSTGLKQMIGGDNAYSITELETLLRPYDRDNDLLPSRIVDVTSLTAGDPTTSPFFSDSRRRLVTTEGRDIPTPDMSGAKRYHVTDVLRQAFIGGGMNALDAAKAIVQNSAPELQRGMPMDLNRLFGNSVDDNGNFVVDEPGEDRWIDDGNGDFDAGADTYTTVDYMVPGGSANAPCDADNNGNLDPAAEKNPRIKFARELYILLMATVDTAWVPLNADGTTPTNGAFARARALAQYSINVADFRDPDGIMTRFAFDDTPFDGSSWSVPTWDHDSDTSTPEVARPENVVWGVERPELLISETTAFHDRRTEDLTTPGDNMAGDNTGTPDTHFDQRYRPEGSLFVELYNPWGPDGSRHGELSYNPGSGGWESGVLLNRWTPSGNAPVWRLAITGETAASDMDKDPDYTTPGGASAPPTIDRAVYFTNLDGLSDDGDLTNEGLHSDIYTGLTPFYSKLVTPRDFIVPWRGYSVILPGESGQDDSTTYIGQLQAPGATPQTSTRRITTVGGFQVYADGTTPSLSTDEQDRTDYVVINEPQRLSVSEPISGYAAPDTTDPNYGWGMYGSPADVPFDNSGFSELSTPGTHNQFRVAHLQRLANPLEDYDPVYNPYLTIDSAQIDLTVFNGVQDPATISGPDGSLGAPEPIVFAARERGETATVGTAAPVARALSAGGVQDLWSAEYPLPTQSPDDAGAVGDSSHIYSEDWQQTLGKLNEPFASSGAWTATDIDALSVTTPSDFYPYIGEPKRPFAWFPWNDRPYVSEHELMLVPMTSSSQMLRYYTADGASTALYSHDTGSSTNPSVNPQFGHVPNFFGDDTSVGSFFKFLGLVHVPSRYVGSEMQLDPTAIASDLTPEDRGKHKFNPPFNYVSRYRDPGKINLNTIPGLSSGDTTGKPIFDALMGGTGATKTTWADFVDSRAGASGMPTQFANPFRGFGGRDLVPLAGMSSAIGSEVQSTLLRSRDGTDLTPPLFGGYPTDAYQDGDASPFFRYRELQRIRNLVTTRSNVYAVWVTVGYFEVEDAEQVRLTQPGPPTPAQWAPYHPDGYCLGQELGADTGDIERHRSFYIIDRSIPVGFQRGKKLNAENAILLKRFIE